MGVASFAHTAFMVVSDGSYVISRMVKLWIGRGFSRSTRNVMPGLYLYRNVSVASRCFWLLASVFLVPNPLPMSDLIAAQRKQYSLGIYLANSTALLVAEHLAGVLDMGGVHLHSPQSNCPSCLA